MRKIGSLPDERQAERFCDYLLTRGVTAVVDAESSAASAEGKPGDGAAGGGGGGKTYHLWIREEDQLETAAEELQRFVAQPDAPQFQVRATAAKIRSQRLQEAKRRIRLQRKLPASAGLPLQHGPVYFTVTLIVLSVAASLITEFGGAGVGPLGRQVWQTLTFVDFGQYIASDDPLVSIKQGQLWRVVTPMFLHGNMPHLAFNMMALYFLGSVVERIHGIGFMAAMTLLCQVVSSLTQALAPEQFGGTPIAVGASGAVVGLFGYLWVRPLLQPSYPVRIPPFFVVLTLAWLLMGVVGVVGGIANVAHASGLLMGMLLAPITVGMQKT